jgi:putative membrane protein
MRIRRSNDSTINKLHFFSRKLPDTPIIFSMLFLLSIITGMVSVALANYHHLAESVLSILAGGVLGGILMVLLPALVTVVIFKSFRRELRIKHLLFITFLGSLAYSLFIILAGAIYQVVGNYPIASIVVLVGDASIYGWWFFINKVVLGQRKRALFFAFVQPIFNILAFFAASGFFAFAFSIGLTTILVKLFAGIIIFICISYIILYIFDNPIKRNLGLGGIDIFSQAVQNWLFDIESLVPQPVGGSKFGVYSDVNVQTIVFRKPDKSIKAIMFAPALHYGPFGIIGGSDFPFQLERYSLSKYGAPFFAVHGTVNEDNNPVSSSQISALKDCLDRSVKNARHMGGRARMEFHRSTYKDSTISILSMNRIGIATFTRAPHVTEDISPEVGTVFRELLEKDGREIVLIDAHNSRYESAPADELAGTTPNSRFMNEYIGAIKGMGGPMHKTSKIKMGVASVDIYDALGRPTDLAPGKLNVMVFFFNGFKYAMIHFNSNNILPNFRTDIVAHAKKTFGVDAEVYTTDTHYINSLEKNASNVLGRETRLRPLLPLVERALKLALEDAGVVEVYYKRDVMKKFHVWGPNIRETMLAVITSVMGIARVLVPAIIAVGFIVASWIISIA